MRTINKEILINFAKWCVENVTDDKRRFPYLENYKYMALIKGEGIGFNNMEDLYNYWLNLS